MRRWRVVLRGMFLIVVLAVPTGTAHAASGFANVAFAQQWQRGEALAPNFWGPLGAARDGQSEAYGEADGGMRLVQYFDKGRMELGHGSTVTNGLLATELVTGRLQTGDTRFADRPSPAIPIAGDSEGGGLTYALLSTKGRQLLDPGPRHLGSYVLSVVSPTGEIAAQSGDAPPYARYAIYEITTKHDVSRAFSDYRNTVGEETIGLAISQPFFTTVQVAGQERDVLVQVFERRVLTYTDSNPDGFKVEMGNVGQHYYRWRYGAPGTGVPGPPAAPLPGTNACIRPVMPHHPLPACLPV